jgi:hypothetical protein
MADTLVTPHNRNAVSNLNANKASSPRPRFNMIQDCFMVILLLPLTGAKPTREAFRQEVFILFTFISNI